MIEHEVTQTREVEIEPTDANLDIEKTDRVPWRGVAEGGSPRSPAWAGSVSWRLPEG
jgi:hypothetical protein